MLHHRVPYVFLDATYPAPPPHRAGHLDGVVVVATAPTASGGRETLGTTWAIRRVEVYWRAFLHDPEGASA